MVKFKQHVNNSSMLYATKVLQGANLKLHILRQAL